MEYFSTFFPSPVGKLRLVASANGLVAVLWENDRPDRVPIGDMQEDDQNHVLLETKLQLSEYFQNKRTAFTVPLDFRGTDFQKSVWRALLTIPFGQTTSYASIARMIGNPRATRAVGAANGKNPVSIIAPCHRVVGSSGALTGFAGGVAGKRYLLDLEQEDLFGSSPAGL